MRKILYIALFCLFIIVPAVYAIQMIHFPGVSTGSACDTVVITNTNAITGDCDIKDTAAYTFVGQTYNEAGAHNICKVTFYLTKKAGTITGLNYFVRIDSLDGSNNMDGNNISDSATVAGVQAWSDTAVDFIFSPAVTIPASTNYVLAVTHDGATGSTNYAEGENTAGAISGQVRRFNADGTTSGGASTSDFKIIIYE